MSFTLHADQRVLEPVLFRVSPVMVESFGELTGDRSSLHFDPLFARRSQYRQNVVHGFVPLLFLSTLKADKVLHGRFGFQRLAASFLKPVYPGDELVLSVTEVSPIDGDRRVELEFCIARDDGGTVVTTGSTTLEATEAMPRTLADCADGRARNAALLSVLLTEENRTLEQINKGDETGFPFVPTAACLRALFEILKAGHASGSLDWKRWLEGCDASNLLPASLFSTMVGMCQPGRTATFLSFDVAFTKPLELDGVHHCRSVVAFKSPTTRTMSENISITRESDGAAQAAGKAHVQVNRSPAVMPSVAELKRTALDLNLRDKVVLITGGSRGIGETTAKLLALHGAKVAINYLQGRSEADRIVEEIDHQGGVAMSVPADVADRARVREMVQTVCGRFGTIDVLINNAVRDTQPIPFLELTWETLAQDLDVILKGAFHCCQEVLPLMVRQQAGKIINLSTVFVEIPPPHQAKYVIAKSALVGLTRSLAVEFASDNIQVNLVVPGMVETDLTRHVGRIFMERARSEIPMNRLATPVDVARAIAFLASSWCSFTTGQKVVVTGGSPPLF